MGEIWFEIILMTIFTTKNTFLLKKQISAHLPYFKSFYVQNSKL